MAAQPAVAGLEEALSLRSAAEQFSDELWLDDMVDSGAQPTRAVSCSSSSSSIAFGCHSSPLSSSAMGTTVGVAKDTPRNTAIIRRSRSGSLNITEDLEIDLDELDAITAMVTESGLSTPDEISDDDSDKEDRSQLLSELMLPSAAVPLAIGSRARSTIIDQPPSLSKSRESRTSAEMSDELIEAEHKSSAAVSSAKGSAQKATERFAELAGEMAKVESMFDELASTMSNDLVPAPEENDDDHHDSEVESKTDGGRGTGRWVIGEPQDCHPEPSEDRRRILERLKSERYAYVMEADNRFLSRMMKEKSESDEGDEEKHTDYYSEAMRRFEEGMTMDCILILEALVTLATKDDECTILRKPSRLLRSSHNDANCSTDDSIESLSSVTLSVVWRRLGECLMEIEQERKAISALRHCLKVDPLDPRAGLLLGLAYTNQGEVDDAIEQLYQWLLKHPTLGRGCLAAKKAKKAELEEGKPLPAKPRNRGGMSAEDLIQVYMDAEKLMQPSEETSDVYLVLGILYNITGQFRKAVGQFEMATQMCPVDPSLWNKLGASFANGGFHDEALYAYKKALKLRPKYVRALTNMAIAHFNLGHFPESCKYYWKSLKINSSAEIWEEFAMSLKEIGRIDLASMAIDPKLRNIEMFDAMMKSEKRERRQSLIVSEKSKLFQCWEYKGGRRRSLLSLLSTIQDVIPDRQRRCGWKPLSVMELSHPVSMEMAYENALLCLDSKNNPLIANDDELLMVCKIVLTALKAAHQAQSQEH